MSAIVFLAGWALRSAALVLTGALLLRALRVKDAAIRLASWTVLLSASLAIPALTALLPARPSHLAGVVTAPLNWEPAPAFVSPPASRPPASLPTTPPPIDWARLALAIYFAGAATLLLRLAVGLAMSRRLLRASRATETLGIRESDDIAAPVALGVLRPAIVLPSNWREWDPARLAAVLAHEGSHIRRRDQAVQALSAVHRALLWHSPVSWLLHRWIVRAAEEAGDDAAVAASGRLLYAETLLDFLCAPQTRWGVGMARYGDPEKRIRRILDYRIASRGLTRPTLAAILALAAPLAYLAAAAQALPSFDVASVKTAEPMPPPGPNGAVLIRNGFPTVEPGRLHYPRETMMRLLTIAYEVQSFQIQGPAWLSRDTFEIDATMPRETNPHQLHLMWQSLLAERFHLAVHHETKEMAGYSLAISRGGLKLKEGATAAPAVAGRAPVDEYGFPIVLAHPPGTSPAPARTGMPPLGFFNALGHRLFFDQRTTGYLSGYLAGILRCPVADETGLTAPYDFTLTYRPDDMPASADATYTPAPDLFTALEEQLGLRLEKKKLNADTIVVDRIERTPTAN